MADSLQLQPLTGYIGARVDGIDLGRELDDQAFGRIFEGLMQFKVLLFPRQRLTAAEHVALGRRFGELVAHPDYPTIEGHEEIMVIENGPERPPDNEYWHKDMTFRPDPPHCSLLHARVLPASGGDTMFCNMQAVYEDLSPPLQSMLEGLSVEHDQVAGFTPTLLANNEIERLEKIRAHPESMRRNVHPAVGVHPVSGNRYLGVDDCFVTRFMELELVESDGLLRLLRSILKQPKYQVRISWQPDDLVIWDNVSTLHYAVGDYSEYRRMQRITVSRYQGGDPIGSDWSGA